jgi:hypothetical protein
MMFEAARIFLGPRLRAARARRSTVPSDVMRFLKSQKAARAAAAVSESDASAERLGRITGRCKSQQTLYPKEIKIEQEPPAVPRQAQVFWNPEDLPDPRP